MPASAVIPPRPWLVHGLDSPACPQHNPAVDIRLIPGNEYRRVRWKNGLGWTREILRWPEDREDWDWRISVAEVEQAGPFSAFEGCDRELVLLSGAGMRLHFETGESIELSPPHGRHRFSGELALQAELVAGPTQDFNLIWRRERVETLLLHRPLVGPMLFFAEPGVRWAIFVMAGQVAFKDQLLPCRLEQGDSAIIDAAPDGDRHRLILDGGGELLLVRIHERG